MPVPRVDIAAVLATFRFASAELGSEEAGMAVAMRAFALSVRGQIERRPRQLILECTCEHFDVALDDLLGDGRTSTVSRARRAAAWLLRANGYSYGETAKALGRKNNTDAIRACHSVDRHEDLQAEVAQVAGMIAERLPAVKGAPVIWPKVERKTCA
jgi:chromosomal replication initiation ATPase DnaA